MAVVYWKRQWRKNWGSSIHRIHTLQFHPVVKFLTSVKRYLTPETSSRSLESRYLMMENAHWVLKSLSNFRSEVKMTGCGRCCQTVCENDLDHRGKDFENARRQSLLEYLDNLRCAPVREMEKVGCLKCPKVARVRRSKKSLRRSSALIKPGGGSTINSSSVSPVTRDAESRMKFVLRECETGSILRGQTSTLKTQASRSNSRSSVHAFSSTKGTRNWRTNNRRKFPTQTRVSNAGHRLPARCCCCSNKRSKKLSNYTSSTTDEESVDYQVPVESSCGCRDTGSGSRTLVPTSSHVTIRICSKESSSTISCDHEQESPCLSESEDSSNHLEERVRRSIDAMRAEGTRNPSTRSKVVFSKGCQTCGNPESSDEGSFQRFKNVLVETRSRRTVKNRPTIKLSAKQYKDFKERCEGIRKSMKRDEDPVWKGPGVSLTDFRPDLPPLNHWSQYEDGMKKVANEYRTLKSCVSLIESEARRPGCCCNEKSITRTYPSGTEFTFKVKRAEDKENGCCPSGEEVLLKKCKEKKPEREREEKFVCFGENKSQDYDEESNVDGMKTRESDLVKTLETFCEKMKSMKSEFEKSSPPGRFRKKKKKKHCKKKLLIFPPEGENGPPLTLYKNSSSVNCRVKGDREIGFRYDVTYVQRFVSSSWYPDRECKRGVDSGWSYISPFVKDVKFLYLSEL